MTISLREYLKMKNLTTVQFAAEIGDGTTHSAVSKWMAGHTQPRRKATERIRQVTGGLVTADTVSDPPQLAPEARTCEVTHAPP